MYVHSRAQLSNIIFQLECGVHGHVEVELVVVLVSCHVSSLHLHCTPNALVLAGYHSVATLGVHMLFSCSALHGVRALCIGARDDLPVTGLVVHLRDGSICASLSAVSALVISVGAVVCEMISQVLPHELVGFTIPVLAFIRAGESCELARGHMLF